MRGNDEYFSSGLSADTLETALQSKGTSTSTLLAPLGDRLLHLVTPVMLVVVPRAAPFLLVVCTTHKRLKPTMSWHLAASAPPPPTVPPIGRHALHITSPCIDRHRCAEATDTTAPLARTSLLPHALEVTTATSVKSTGTRTRTGERAADTVGEMRFALLACVRLATLLVDHTTTWAALPVDRTTFGLLALLAMVRRATILHHTTTPAELP